jgi:hypothetical protein
MKMLGQDIHTQQEFDAFLEEKFNPLEARIAVLSGTIAIQKQEIQELKKKKRVFEVLSIIAGVASVIAIALTVL